MNMEDLQEEIDALIAIFPDTVSVSQENGVYTIHAALKPEQCADIEEGFVEGEIEFILDKMYLSENSIRKISFSRSRGLGLETIQEITSKLYDQVAHYEPPLLFQLISTAEDLVRDIRIPTLPCSICLCDFDETNPFMKTKCFHIFHHECFAMWYAVKVEDYNREKLAQKKTGSTSKIEHKGCWCPVCRKTVDISDIQSFSNLVQNKLKEYKQLLHNKQIEASRRQEEWQASLESKSAEDEEGENVLFVADAHRTLDFFSD
eukprot:CAMPEP_0117016808 /NCGR_PEP_ID=MMETSP0472-20121206/13214_1 /TAXON_ID=693140 ORGANISM="Tiarina fusus, Strain LIS" /NCGR_SAMPLE_ID=MMETSP0472 /ASSEMBLY_ACC=CAM_ASM_000603 /LENGTH=260 /DNA_ID=CAMNT_0004720999 /DNA_START=84 /DNA_END=863 /DNA_ORIENTATION=+